MRVEHADAAPNSLGRDAYRIVQEALTNIGKHASETTARVTITGAPGDGLHISVRNRQPVHAPQTGVARLGRRTARAAGTRALAGGTLVHGPDGSGDFVVDAELQW